MILCVCVCVLNRCLSTCEEWELPRVALEISAGNDKYRSTKASFLLPAHLCSFQHCTPFILASSLPFSSCFCLFFTFSLFFFVIFHIILQFLPHFLTHFHLIYFCIPPSSLRFILFLSSFFTWLASSIPFLNFNLNLSNKHTEKHKQKDNTTPSFCNHHHTIILYKEKEMKIKMKRFFLPK